MPVSDARGFQTREAKVGGEVIGRLHRHHRQLISATEGRRRTTEGPDRQSVLTSTNTGRRRTRTPARHSSPSAGGRRNIGGTSVVPSQPGRSPEAGRPTPRKAPGRVLAGNQYRRRRRCSRTFGDRHGRRPVPEAAAHETRRRAPVSSSVEAARTQATRHGELSGKPSAFASQVGTRPCRPGGEPAGVGRAVRAAVGEGGCRGGRWKRRQELRPRRPKYAPKFTSRPAAGRRRCALLRRRFRTGTRALAPVPSKATSTANFQEVGASSCGHERPGIGAGRARQIRREAAGGHGSAAIMFMFERPPAPSAEQEDRSRCRPRGAAEGHEVAVPVVSPNSHRRRW